MESTESTGKTKMSVRQFRFKSDQLRHLTKRVERLTKELGEATLEKRVGEVIGEGKSARVVMGYQYSRNKNFISYRTRPLMETEKGEQNVG